MISPATRYKLELLRDDIAEWGELIFWASIGISFACSIVASVIWAAWHVFWWVMMGVA
ncbi:hypothetical protein [Rhodococcus sp. B10]|uniref:hypothetical protein n=1 Tax=Rhodococcus sp. B10 TaxID=2695876 RepID=UPI001431359A|nr:hypothetical protein [Rhodococcus sp. B10]NIL77171.1 hypothetical protein [Rhodococcus sp. B10]